MSSDSFMLRSCQKIKLGRRLQFWLRTARSRPGDRRRDLPAASGSSSPVSSHFRRLADPD